jgi:hypothetical protein
MNILYVFVLFISGPLLVESKGMWGARRRRADSDYSKMQDRQSQDTPNDSETLETSDFKIDKEVLEQYKAQVEEALSMMEQFIKSPECTPEFLVMTMREMVPTLFEQPGFEKSLQLPDKRTLRKKLYEAVKFVRKVFREVDAMDATGALSSPQGMVEYISNMITPNLVESIKSVVTVLEPHMEAIQEQFLDSLDPESLAMLQPMIDAMITMGQAGPRLGDIDTMDTDDLISYSLKTLLGGLKTPAQVNPANKLRL